MKFVFKRKYTFTFFVFLVLIGISLAFYFFGPKFINRDGEFFRQVLWISLLDSVLIAIFILGLYRVNYYLYYDHIEIHRSLRKTVNLSYDQIQELIESPNDKIFLFWGKRPSFKIKYKANNKIKNYRIRVSKHDLFKLIMQNEHQIHITENE
jgi:hypothetical protein